MPISKIEELKIQAKILLKTQRAAGAELTLGQALDQIAAKQGHPDWRSYKRQHDVDELLYPPNFSRLLNHWFAHYPEAKAFLDEHPAMFLLPYRSQFFVCELGFVEGLGILAGDTLLKLVGNDWTQPKDAGAWDRLLQKLRLAREEREA